MDGAVGCYLDAAESGGGRAADASFLRFQLSSEASSAHAVPILKSQSDLGSVVKPPVLKENFCRSFLPHSVDMP